VADSNRPRIEQPELEAHLDRLGVDAEVRAFCTGLAENGVGLLDLGEEARALCDRAVAETDPYFADGATVRVQDAWRRAPAVRALAADAKLMRALRVAYGREPFPFQTLNFPRGSDQAVHADSVHFNSDPPGFVCGGWIALEDIAPDAGPLVYQPGSHHLPPVTVGNRAFPTLEDYNSHYLPAMARRVEASGLPVKTALLKKGQALVWAAELAHGGGPIANHSSTRRSLVAHVYFKGCAYYSPMFSDVEAGRLALRLPANLRTGGWEWPRRGAMPLWPGLQTIRESVAVGLRRMVFPS